MNQNGTWPHKTAIVISDSKNLGLHVKQAISGHGWQLLAVTTQLLPAVKAIETGKAGVLIIDDQMNRPATIIVRQLLRFPFAFCVPIVVLASEEHSRERILLSRMVDPSIVDKPFVASKFQASFWKILRKWETQPFLALRLSFYRYLRSSNVEMGRWQTLLATPGIGTLATSALALMLYKTGDLESSEKLLLQSIKMKNSNAGTVLVLADIYLMHAMPAMAKKLLTFADRDQPGLTLLPDLVQADLMLGEWDSAIKKLTLLCKQGFLEPQSRYILTNLLKLVGEQKVPRQLISA